MTYLEVFKLIKTGKVKDILDEVTFKRLDSPDWTLEQAMVHIAYNNSRKYQFAPVPFEKLVENEDGTFLDLGEYGVIPIKDTAERIEQIRLHQDLIRTAISKHPDGGYLVLLAFGENPDKADEEMKDIMIKDMIKALDIHSRGRLRVLFEEAMDAYAGWVRGYQRFGDQYRG